MRGPLGEYIRATALACKICGSESEILPLLASTYQQAVGRAVGERQSWGSFPRWGQGLAHVPKGACECQGRDLLWTLPQQGWAQGVFLGMLHPSAGTCLYRTGSAVFCAPVGFSGPLALGKVCNHSHRAREILPQPGGLNRGVPALASFTLVSHHMSVPRQMQACGRINHSGSLQGN